MRLIFLAALLALAVSCGVDRGSYVSKNEGILESLPEIDGAARVKLTSSPYYEDEHGPLPSRPVGYTTNVVYEVPPDVTDRQVVDFYAEALKAEWDYEVEEVPIVQAGPGKRVGTVLLLHCTQGEATVSVNTDNMEPGSSPHTFEVVVDHQGNK